MTTEIRLPPLLTLHAVVSDADAFEIACAGAAAGDLGAGDVVFAPGRAERARLAIVLEPEVPESEARQMLPLLAVALADALGVLLPPKVAIEHRWPSTLLLNGAAVAQLSIAMAASGDGEPPAWLVVGADVALTLPQALTEPGGVLDRTALAEEGGAEIAAAGVLEALSSQFLRWLDTWQERGFEPVAQHWLFRAEGRLDPVTIRWGSDCFEARVVGLDPTGDLRVARGDGTGTKLELAAVLPHLVAEAARNGT